MNTLRGLPVDDDVKIFIGKENLLRQIESCSLMVTTYEAQGYDGYIGVLGPKRMRYPFNRAIVEKVKELLV
jgi:transcriptional regulator of heat shock response